VSIKRGLPTSLTMRHDSHYVEEMSRGVVGKNIGRLLPIDKIEPNPEQPRVEIGDLSELSSSIKQKGVLEPLLVKPQNGSWMIIAGERRWRAANLAGLREVPCIELDIDDKNIAEIALIENLQRKDLTIWEEADGLASLSSRFGYTHDEIAKKIGKSRTTVTESMAIANLPDSVRDKCREAKLNAKSTLLEISRQFDEKEMLKLVETIQNKGVVTREKVRKITRPLPKLSTIIKEEKPTDKKIGTSKVEEKPVQNNIAKFNNPAIIPNKSSPTNELTKLMNAPLHNASNRLSATETRKNVFMYADSDGDFSIEIKFLKKAKYELSDVIEALNQTLNFWDKMNR
jgi:ParB family chromosome partitioning protein